jgi:hypothetical protein
MPLAAHIAALRARLRAAAQTSLIAVEATGWPRSLLKIRPSAAMPKVSMCWRRMAASSGGIGTRRVSLAGRCLSPRSSWADAVSVQRRLTSGRDFSKVRRPQPVAGR